MGDRGLRALKRAFSVRTAAWSFYPLDPGDTAQRRESSAGQVFAAVREITKALQRLRNSGGILGQKASKVLEHLRAVLLGPRVLGVKELGMARAIKSNYRVLIRGLETSTDIDELKQQVEFGILALKWVRQNDRAEEQLGISVGAFLQNVDRLFVD